MTKRQARPLEPVPDWPAVAKIVPSLEAALAADNALVAEVDQARAYLRDTLDGLGISVRDEPSVYVVLAAAGVFVEMAKIAVSNGLFNDTFSHGVAELARTISLSLLEYLPPEARTSSDG